MSYFKDENRNPLDYYGLRQPAIKQQLMPSYEPITKPTRDTSAYHRSNSLNKEPITIQSNSRLILQRKVIQLEKELQECDFQRQANIVYNRQFRQIGRLLGDENMEFDEIRSKIEDMILQGPVSGNIHNKGTFSQANIGTSEKSVNLLRQQITQLKYQLTNQRNISMGLRDKLSRYEMTQQQLRRQNSQLLYKLQVLRREIDTIKNSNLNLNAQLSYSASNNNNNSNTFQLFNRSREAISYNGTQVTSSNWMTKLRQKDLQLQQKDNKINQLLMRLQQRNQYQMAEKDYHQSQLSTKYKQIQKKYNYYSSQYQKLQQRLAQYECKIRQNQQAIEKYHQMEGQFVQLDKNYNFMQSQLQLSKHQLEKSKHEIEKGRKYEEEYESLRKKLEDKERKVLDYEFQLREVKSKLTLNESVIQTYKQKISTYQYRINQYQQSKRTFQTQRFQQKDKTRKQFETQLYNLQKQLSTTKGDLYNLERQLSVTKRQLQLKQDQLLFQKEKTKQQQNEIIKLGEYIQRLNEDITKYQLNSGQVGKLQLVIRQNESVIDQYKKEVFQSKAEISQLQRQITQLNEQVSSRRKQSQESFSNRNNLNQQVLLLQQQLDSKTSDFDKLQQKYHQTSDQFHSLQEKIHQLQSQVQQLQSQVHNYQTQVHNYQSQLHNLQSQLHSKSNQLSLSQTKYSTLKQQYNQLNRVYEQKSLEVMELTKKYQFAISRQQLSESSHHINNITTFNNLNNHYSNNQLTNSNANNRSINNFETNSNQHINSQSRISMDRIENVISNVNLNNSSNININQTSLIDQSIKRTGEFPVNNTVQQIGNSFREEYKYQMSNPLNNIDEVTSNLQQNNSSSIKQSNSSNLQQNSSKENFNVESSQVQYKLVNFNNPNYNYDNRQLTQDKTRQFIGYNQNSNIIHQNTNNISSFYAQVNNTQTYLNRQINSKQVIKEENYYEHTTNADKEYIQQLSNRVTFLEKELSIVRNSSQTKTEQITLLHKRIEELQLQVSQLTKKIDFYQQSSSRQNNKQYSGNFGSSTHNFVDYNYHQNIIQQHNINTNNNITQYHSNSNILNTNNNIIQAQPISQLTKKSIVQDEQNKKSIQGQLSGSSFKYYQKKSEHQSNSHIEVNDQNSIYGKTQSVSQKNNLSKEQITIKNEKESPIKKSKKSIKENQSQKDDLSQKIIYDNESLSEPNSLSKLVMGNTVNMISSSNHIKSTNTNNNIITSSNKIKQSQSKIQISSLENLQIKQQRQSHSSIHQSQHNIYEPQNSEHQSSHKSIKKSSQKSVQPAQRSLHEKINDISVEDEQSISSNPNIQSERSVSQLSYKNGSEQNLKPASEISDKQSQSSSQHHSKNHYELPQYSKKNNKETQITSNKLIANKVTEITNQLKQSTHSRQETEKKQSEKKPSQIYQQPNQESSKQSQQNSRKSSLLSVNAVSQNQMQVQVNNTKKLIQMNQNTQSNLQPSHQSSKSINSNNPPTQLPQSTTPVKNLSVIASNSQIQSGLVSRNNSIIRQKRQQSNNSSLSRKGSPSPGRISITYGRESKIIYNSGMKPRQSLISIPQQDRPTSKPAYRESIITNIYNHGNYSPLNSPVNNNLTTNQNIPQSTTNIDRRATLPLVSSKNIIQTRSFNANNITTQNNINATNNSQQHIVFNNNLKSSRVIVDNTNQAQSSQIFTTNNNNRNPTQTQIPSTMRPITSRTSSRQHIPSRFKSPQPRLSKEQIQLQTLVNDEYSPMNANLQQTVPQSIVYQPYFNQTAQTIPKSQYYANEMQPQPYQKYNQQTVNNLSPRNSDIKKSVFTGNLQGSQISQTPQPNQRSQICCAISPSHYQHQNKKSSLSNSQISKFNVVKQSRVSNQVAQNNLNNTQQYRSSFAERLQINNEKIFQLSQSVAEKNSQQNDANNFSMAESEDSGINVFQNEESGFDCCKR